MAAATASSPLGEKNDLETKFVSSFWLTQESLDLQKERGSSAAEELPCAAEGDPQVKRDIDRVKETLFNHRSSLETLTDLQWLESRVLILYTGGTIGMVSNTRGKLAPQPGELEKVIRKYPHMHDERYAQERFSSLSTPPLVLPDCREKKRTVYWVHEYNPLLDSSDMTMDDWIRISEDIKIMYEDFDGFVILHGTDTLGYTAAALSFMLQDLGKPVVITGSQIPLFETRSDGRDNFIGSLIMAGSYNIPEVTVFFNNKLFRGNRTAKVSTGSLNAFDSPNFPPLASAGISISVEHRNIFRPATLAKFSVFSDLSRDVGLLRIFPSIMLDTVKSFLQPPLKGAVIQTYGSGNIPSSRKDLIEVFREASARGVLIVNITQCMHGGVEALYETGAVLESAGVLSGLDMTPEAALSKLSYVLSKEQEFESRKKMMQTNLRGEMTLPQSTNSPANEEDEMVEDIIGAIGKALELSSEEDKFQLQELLVPNLFLSAVQNSDISRMKKLFDHVLDINAQDAMGATALHIAANEGDLEVVKWLLLHGALVHIRDLKGHTPLWVAVAAGHDKVIDLLVTTGAHLTELPTQIGETLVSTAASANIKKLQSFVKAGVDINMPDALGRTALHAACLVGSKETVKFLLSNGACVLRKDKAHLSPAMCAQANNFADIVDLCTPKKTMKHQSTTGW